MGLPVPRVSPGIVTTGCFFPLTDSLSPFHTALAVCLSPSEPRSQQEEGKRGWGIDSFLAGRH